jgi:hypothetical protein
MCCVHLTHDVVAGVNVHACSWVHGAGAATPRPGGRETLHVQRVLRHVGAGAAELVCGLCRDVLNSSTDECNLDVAGCVLLPPLSRSDVPVAVRRGGHHHTGQSLQDVDVSIPLYCPNSAPPDSCPGSLGEGTDSEDSAAHGDSAAGHRSGDRSGAE